MSSPDVALKAIIGEAGRTVALATVVQATTDSRQVEVERDGQKHLVRRLDSYKPAPGDRAVLVRLESGIWILIGALA